MSTNKFQYWPSNGQLGSTKFTMPTNAEDWPGGDALIGNFVYSEGKLVDFIDTKALVANESKSTTFPYDYVNIQVDKSLEGVMTFNQGERTKYFTISYIESGNSGGTIVLGTKYLGCKTVDDVKAVDSNYTTSDIINGAWTQSLADLEDGTYEFFGMFYMCSNLETFISDLSSLTSGDMMFFMCPNLKEFNCNLNNLSRGNQMFCGCSNLKEFNCNLNNLTYGTGMFADCSSLTTFICNDLSSLIDGEDMFLNCNLSAESVENIANSLPTVSDNNPLTLGVDLSSVPSTYAAVETPGRWIEWYENSSLGHFIPHLQTIVDKGWVVTLNNKALEEWRYYYNPTDPT